MDYRRAWRPGGTDFFTVNLLQRHGNDLLIRNIDNLRHAIARVRQLYPFKIPAWVVLPEHMHLIIELPENDFDFATRLRLIKMMFSKQLPPLEHRSGTRLQRGERGIWQRRYWEHLIRDQADYNAHMDYVHTNPLKHGLVKRVIDWPYSTFHRLIEKGIYSAEWGGGHETILDYED